MARGFKIAADEVKLYRNLLEFISGNGFEVNIIDGEQIIQSHRRRVLLTTDSQEINKYIRYNSPPFTSTKCLYKAATCCST